MVAPGRFRRFYYCVYKMTKVNSLLQGAGISTSSGIPDFRSSEGLFEKLKRQHPEAKLQSGKDLFDASLFKSEQNTALFYHMISELYTLSQSAQPTAFHTFLKELDDSGKLFRVYTQNIDGLESRAGLTFGLPPASAISSFSAGGGTKRKRNDGDKSFTTKSKSRTVNLITTEILGPLSSCSSTTSLPSSSQNSDYASTSVEQSEAEADSAPKRITRNTSVTSSSSDLTPLPSPTVSSTNLRQEAKSSLNPSASQNSQRPSSPAKKRQNEKDPVTNSSKLIPRCIPLHGKLDTMTCLLCHAVHSIEPHLDSLKAGNSVQCPACLALDTHRSALGERSRGIGYLKPDVVLYGEEHLNAEEVGAVTRRDLMGVRPDLLIVVGTSLKVKGTRLLVRELGRVIKPAPKLEEEEEDQEENGEEKKKPRRKKDRPVHAIFLNNMDFPTPAKEWTETFDVWLKGDIQHFVSLVKKEEAKMKHEQEEKERLKIEKQENKLAKEQEKEEKRVEKEKEEKQKAKEMKKKDRLKAKMLSKDISKGSKKKPPAATAKKSTKKAPVKKVVPSSQSAKRRASPDQKLYERQLPADQLQLTSSKFKVIIPVTHLLKSISSRNEFETDNQVLLDSSGATNQILDENINAIRRSSARLCKKYEAQEEEDAVVVEALVPKVQGKLAFNTIKGGQKGGGTAKMMKGF